jgi:hypothetical protein
VFNGSGWLLGGGKSESVLVWGVRCLCVVIGGWCCDKDVLNTKADNTRSADIQLGFRPEPLSNKMVPVHKFVLNRNHYLAKWFQYIAGV